MWARMNGFLHGIPNLSWKKKMILTRKQIGRFWPVCHTEFSVAMLKLENKALFLGFPRKPAEYSEGNCWSSEKRKAGFISNGKLPARKERGFIF